MSDEYASGGGVGRVRPSLTGLLVRWEIEQIAPEKPACATNLGHHRGVRPPSKLQAWRNALAITALGCVILG